MSTTLTKLDLDQLSIDAMSHRRNRASQFGHLGTPMGISPTMFYLFSFHFTSPV